MDDSQRISPPNVVGSTSSRLLDLVRNHDASAWRQLLQVYGPVVRYWIRRSDVTSADLPDVFQNVFSAVFGNVHRFQRKDGRGSFRKWLKTITNSKIMDHYRKVGRQANAVGGSTAHGKFVAVPEKAVDQSTIGHVSDETVMLQQVMHLIQNEFSPENWQAFWRTVVDGRTSTEAADELGTSPATVRKAKSRVLARLRKAVEEYDAY